MKCNSSNISKVIFLATAICAVMLTFGGCMSRSELNDKLIIEGIGIDKANDRYSLTVMTLNTESTEEVLPPEVINVSGKSVSECFENISRDTGREILLSDNKFIIMDKFAAEQADEVLSYFNSSFEARPDILLYVSDESTKKLLQNENVLKSMSAEDIAMIGGEYSGGTVRSCRFKEFKASDNSGLYDVSVPVLTLSEDKSRIIPDGSALFENGKMSGSISADESVVLNILSDDGDGAVISMSDDKGESIPVEIVSLKSENGLRLDGGKFIYSENLNMTIDIHRNDGEALLKNKKFLGEIEEFLEESCSRTANKVVKTYDSDILKIGKKAQNGFYTEFSKISDWHEELKSVGFRFNVSVVPSSE